MSRHTFLCIDGHTCGNPVRLVAGGGPQLDGATMLERRAHFLAEYDWIRTGLMFEPRGHDMMSGSILYPPTRQDCDIAILFIETSGCLPMCGHGTIGTVTMAIENGLVTPKTPGTLRLDTPAGLVVAEYRQEGQFVEEVRITNVPAFLHSRGLEVDCPGLGPLTWTSPMGATSTPSWAPSPPFATWPMSRPATCCAGAPCCGASSTRPTSSSIRRSPISGASATSCGRARPGTLKPMPAMPCSTARRRSTARPAAPGPRPAWPTKRGLGRLQVGDDFVHESIIGSLFRGRVEAAAKVGNYDAIIPSVGGWARQTGINTIFIDDRDPFAHGFQVI